MLTFTSHVVKQSLQNPAEVYQITITSDSIETMNTLANILDDCIMKKDVTIIMSPVGIGDSVYLIENNAIREATVTRITQEIIDQLLIQVRYNDTLTRTIKESDFGETAFSKLGQACQKLTGNKEG